MTDKIEAKVTHRFAASPERVYEALVDPDLARRWNEAWLLHDGGTGALTRFDFDPQQYGRFHVAGHRNGEASDSWGTFLTLEKPTKPKGVDRLKSRRLGHRRYTYQTGRS